MTRICHGYAQPDIEATKGQETRLIFVETPESMDSCWAAAIKKSFRWLQQHRPDVQIDFIITKPHRKPYHKRSSAISRRFKKG